MLLGLSRNPVGLCVQSGSPCRWLHLRRSRSLVHQGSTSSTNAESRPDSQNVGGCGAIGGTFPTLRVIERALLRPGHGPNQTVSDNHCGINGLCSWTLADHDPHRR